MGLIELSRSSQLISECKITFVFDESPCRSCLLVVSVAVGARCSNLRNNAATLVLPVERIVGLI